MRPARALPACRLQTSDCQTAPTVSVRKDPVWDFVTQVTRPEMDATLFRYDPATGNRLYQQPGSDATDTTRRVTFMYEAQYGLLASVRQPSTPGDSVAYDALGNVRGVRTPRGYWTMIENDSVGRPSECRHQLTRRTAPLGFRPADGAMR